MMLLLTSFNTFAAKQSKIRTMEKKISSAKVKAKSQKKVSSQKSLAASEAAPFCPDRISLSPAEIEAQIAAKKALLESTASMETQLKELKKEAARATVPGGDIGLSEQEIAEILRVQQNFEEAAAIAKEKRLQLGGLTPALSESQGRMTPQELEEIIKNQKALELAAQIERKKLLSLKEEASENSPVDAPFICPNLPRSEQQPGMSLEEQINNKTAFSKGTR